MENLAKGNSEQPEKKDKSLGAAVAQAIRRRMAAGIITIIPIGVTIGIIYFVFKWINRIFQPVIFYAFGIENRIFSVVISLFLALSVIYFLGLLSSIIVIRRLIELGERLIYRIPFIKFFYLTTKKLVDTIAAPQKSAFKKVVVVEYPRKGIKSLAFVTGEIRLGASEKLHVTVFLPTTPNPTSGFFLMLPKEEVLDTNLNLEEGIKMIISGGVVAPEELDMKEYEPMAENEKPAVTL